MITLGIAGILQLSEHLCVRQLLRRIGCARAEDGAHERRLANVLQGKHVLRDGGLDDGIAHIGQPARLVVLEASGAGVAAEVQVVVKRESEGVAAFGQAPMGRLGELVAAHAGILQPPMQQQRCGTAQEHLEPRSPWGPVANLRGRQRGRKRGRKYRKPQVGCLFLINVSYVAYLRKSIFY